MKGGTYFLKGSRRGGGYIFLQGGEELGSCNETRRRGRIDQGKTLSADIGLEAKRKGRGGEGKTPIGELPGGWCRDRTARNKNNEKNSKENGSADRGQKSKE